MSEDQGKPNASFHFRFSEILGRSMALWVNGGLSRKSFAVWVRGTVYGRKHDTKILLGHEVVWAKTLIQNRKKFKGTISQDFSYQECGTFVCMTLLILYLKKQFLKLWLQYSSLV